MPRRRGQHTNGILHVEHAQLKLFEMIDTLRAASGLSCRVDCRQEQRHENANDRDHDQQFHECKSTLPSGVPLGMCFGFRLKIIPFRPMPIPIFGVVWKAL